MGDVETALAFVARRSGKRSMPPSEWAHTLSFGLGWMPPAAANAMVEAAKGAGVLASDGDGGALRLVPDPASHPAPLGFRPNPQAPAAPAPAPGGFLDWVDRLGGPLQTDRAGVLARVAAVQEQHLGLLTADAAVLCLAADAGLDVRRDAVRLTQGAQPAAAASGTP